MSPLFDQSFRSSRRSLLWAVAGAAAASFFGQPDIALAADERPLFLYFWGVGCPHCARAKPFVAKLRKQHPDLRFEAYEVRKSVEGRRRLAKEVKRLQIRDPGVPMFVCGDSHVMGWVPGETERSVRHMVARCKSSAR